MDELGWKFWLWVIGVSLAVGLGGLLLFLLVSGAWYRWGFLGGMIFFGALLLGAAWVYDRRQAKRYEYD